ncbi:MAG: transposase [Erysipelotrichaceae bacterium]|nr:transposase [Erysipelotrichaceae bacterium]
MLSNNSKYSEEFRNQTAEFIIENNRSATSVAEEPGIDVNTVCRWVTAYRRAHNMPTQASEKSLKKAPSQMKTPYSSYCICAV